MAANNNSNIKKRSGGLSRKRGQGGARGQSLRRTCLVSVGVLAVLVNSVLLVGWFRSIVTGKDNNEGAEALDALLKLTTETTASLATSTAEAITSTTGVDANQALSSVSSSLESISSSISGGSRSNKYVPPPVLAGMSPTRSPPVNDIFYKTYDVCIVGAGLAGAVLAERYASELKAHVLVLEQRSHIGGNSYSVYDAKESIRWSPYGNRFYMANIHGTLTTKYLSNFCRKWPTVDPLHSQEYTQGADSQFTQPAGQPKYVMTPVNSAFTVPQDGYTRIMDQMLSSPLITVVLDTNYLDLDRSLLQSKCGGRLYVSGRMDDYFGNSLGRLQYESIPQLEKKVSSDAQKQPHFVVTYPDERVLEYKHLPFEEHRMRRKSSSVYLVEKTSSSPKINSGDPYRPVESSKPLFEQYKALADKEKGVTFIGGLASAFEYWDMYQTVEQSLQIFGQHTKLPFKGGNVRGESFPVYGMHTHDEQRDLVSFAERLQYYSNTPPQPMTAELQAQVDKALQLEVGEPYGLRHLATGVTGKDAIMGLAAYKQNMGTFVMLAGSLRKNGYDGHIIFGVHKEIPKAEEEYLQKMNVTYYEVEFVQCDQSIMDVGSAGGAIRGLCSKGLEKLKLEWGRFEMCRQWLHACKTCTGWTLVMDTRDVFFQAHPFLSLPPAETAQHDLLFIEEIAPHSNPKPAHWLRADIVGESRYTGRTEPCYGFRHFTAFYNRPVLCSGTIIGTRQGMHRFLSVLVDEFYQNNHKTNKMCRSPHATDQWTMDYLYYSGRFGFYNRTKTLPWGTGPVNTIGTPCVNREMNKNNRHSQNDLVVHDPKTDMILNLHELDSSKARISPVVHQYDRCAHWVNGWLNKHRDLYRDGTIEFRPLMKE